MYPMYPMYRLMIAAVSLALAASLPAFGAQSQDAQPSEVWNLGDLYPSPQDWEKERVALAAELPALAALKGTLGSGSGQMLAALDRISGVERRLYRLETYAGLAADLDLRDAKEQERRQLARNLATQFDEVTAFVKSEVVALGRARVEQMLKSEPRLAPHSHALTSMLRLAEHTLGAAEEALLAGAADPLGQAQEIYSLLTNAELPWPRISIDGKEVLLDQETYVKYRSNADPAVRKQVFEAFWPVFKAYTRTLGAIYLANLKGTAFEARVRHYQNSVSMALSSQNTPEAVYRTLVAEANAGLPALHRYLNLRKKTLGIKEAGYPDMYVALAPPPRRYTLAEAEALTLDAVKPLGSEYGELLRGGFGGSWMHAVAQRGKRSGAYMNGLAYDVHPYLLMSFNDDYSSVTTLAHEWGHAMHSVYSNRAQPFPSAEYAIFVAEIPSTANELLLADHVIATAKTREEKIFALSQELEGLRTTFYRQAMFAEFELKSHEAVEKGEALTGERLSAIYLDLLRRYHGHAQGVVTIDDLYGVEWAYIPHFYRDFYVFQYSTCQAAAAYFVEGIENGDLALRQRYFEMLSAGSSDDPYRIVRRAGPDLASPEPYRALVRRMNRGVDQLEALLGQR